MIIIKHNNNNNNNHNSNNNHNNKFGLEVRMRMQTWGATRIGASHVNAHACDYGLHAVDRDIYWDTDKGISMSVYTCLYASTCVANRQTHSMFILHTL